MCIVYRTIEHSKFSILSSVKNCHAVELHVAKIYIIIIIFVYIYSYVLLAFIAKAILSKIKPTCRLSIYIINGNKGCMFQLLLGTSFKYRS